MNLYEINEQIRRTLDNITIDENGEIDAAAMSCVESAEQEKRERVLSIAKYIKEKKNDIQAMKSAEKDMADRRKSLEKKTSGLGDYIVEFIDKPIEDVFVRVSKRKSERIVFDDSEAFLKIYGAKKVNPFIDFKESVSVNKRELKSFIEKNGEFGGARIEECYNLQVK